MTLVGEGPGILAAAGEQLVVDVTAGDDEHDGAVGFDLEAAPRGPPLQQARRGCPHRRTRRPRGAISRSDTWSISSAVSTANRRRSGSRRAPPARPRSWRSDRTRPPRPACHDSAITGASSETTPTRRVVRRASAERPADAGEQRAVSDGHDDGRRRLVAAGRGSPRRSRRSRRAAPARRRPRRTAAPPSRAYAHAPRPSPRRRRAPDTKTSAPRRVKSAELRAAT